MEVTGKILQIFEVKQFSDKFSIQEFLIETTGEYPKKVMLQANEKIRPYINRMGAGATGTFKFDCESKEFNGKWFTNIKCYAVNEA
jgi:hypothetical protein